MTRIVAVNGSPRKGWNTDLLVEEAAKGAEAAGAEVARFDLYKLEKFTGCVSCFGCKREKTLGKCIWQDGLTPVLEAIREADGLIIGTPNYLGNISAGFRALYERLIFQYITYKKEVRSYNDRKIPVFLIMVIRMVPIPDIIFQCFHGSLCPLHLTRMSIHHRLTSVLLCPSTIAQKASLRLPFASGVST